MFIFSSTELLQRVYLVLNLLFWDVMLIECFLNIHFNFFLILDTFNLNTLIFKIPDFVFKDSEAASSFFALLLLAQLS